MTGQVRTVDGRVAGRRGQATRQKLLDCLGEMLSSSPYRDVKVIDVARKAGTSPATFYQYFPDVEGAVLEIAEEMAKEGAGLTELVSGRSWVGKAGFGRPPRNSSKASWTSGANTTRSSGSSTSVPPRATSGSTRSA